MFVHQILEQKGQLSVKSQGRVTSQAIADALKKKGVLTLVVDTDKAFSVSSGEPEPNKEAPVSKKVAEKAPKASLESELTRATKLHVQGKRIQKQLLSSVKKSTAF